MNRPGLNPSLSIHSVGFAALFLIACAVGCDIPARPPLRPEDVPPIEIPELGTTAASATTTTPLEAPGKPFQGQWESWDAYFVKDQQVGYSHVIAESNGENVRYQLDSSLYVEQGESRFLQRLTQESTETAEGELLDFTSVLRVGPAVTRFVGTVDDSNLRIESTRGSEKNTETIPWESNYRGLVALEQSLRRQPMTELGEKRTLKMLLPGQYQLATAHLFCSGKAFVPLIDGKPAELTEINAEIRMDDGGPSYSTIWINDEGGIVRTYSPSLQLIAFRTDQDTATGFPGNDLRVASINVEGALQDPASVRRAAFKVTPTTLARRAESTIDVQPSPGQYVRAMDDGTFQVLVSRLKEKVAKGFVTSDLTPSEADLRANHFVDSNTTLVRRFADAAVSSRDMTKREIALELVTIAHSLIDDKPESTGFTKASEIVRDLVGDSTGRAVLLAALLRARQIPSRLAIGVKYSDDTEPNRMVYHTWTIAYVDDQWLHLDATSGTVAPADRLMLTTTNLSEGDEYDSFVPLLEVMSRVKLQIVGQK